MNRRVLAATTLVLVGLGGAVTFKAWRYRQDAQRWHDRWLSLHRDPGGRARYADDDERLRAMGRVPHRVVFLGASITERLDLRRLFPDRNFVNRGEGGQLVWQQWLRLDPDALSLSPEAVVIKMCAINLLDDAPPFEETQYYYAAMAEMIRSHRVKVILATMIPVTRGYDQSEGGGITVKITRFNAWVRDQARVHQDTLMDYAAAIADDEGYLPDALSDDGLHPNRLGMERMAQTIRTVLIEGRGQPLPPVDEPGPVEGAGLPGTDLPMRDR